MAKESYFFSHDYGARNDPKMQKLLMKLGQAGKGVYWDLIEILYEEGGRLRLDEIDSYAFYLRTDNGCITKLINDFNLFEKDDLFFWSESVLRRLDRRFEKSKKASQSAQTRWTNANASKTNANASKNDAIKETIGKERKGKDKIYSPSREDCISFFKEKKISVTEAEKFFTKYDGLGWMISGSPILKWQSIAESWILKIAEFSTNNLNNHKNDTKRPIQPEKKGFGNLHADRTK